MEELGSQIAVNITNYHYSEGVTQNLLAVIMVVNQWSPICIGVKILEIMIISGGPEIDRGMASYIANQNVLTYFLQ